MNAILGGKGSLHAFDFKNQLFCAPPFAPPPRGRRICSPVLLAPMHPSSPVAIWRFSGAGVIDRDHRPPSRHQEISVRKKFKRVRLLEVERCSQNEGFPRAR